MGILVRDEISLIRFVELFLADHFSTVFNSVN